MRAIDKMVELIDEKMEDENLSYQDILEDLRAGARRLAAEEKSGDDKPSPAYLEENAKLWAEAVKTQQELYRENQKLQCEIDRLYRHPTPKEAPAPSRTGELVEKIKKKLAGDMTQYMSDWIKEELLEILRDYEATAPASLCDELKAEKEEPKDCGFTLATCPYERCSGITMRKEEPLAVISQLCRRAFETAKAHGWKHDNDGQEIALMHSELSEALEAIRKPGKKDEHLPDLDPVGLEMADVLIRIFDYCGARGIDLATCVKEKMDYNDNRPFKHGGKAF